MEQLQLPIILTKKKKSSNYFYGLYYKFSPYYLNKVKI